MKPQRPAVLASVTNALMSYESKRAEPVSIFMALVKPNMTVGRFVTFRPFNQKDRRIRASLNQGATISQKNSRCLKPQTVSLRPQTVSLQVRLHLGCNQLVAFEIERSNFFTKATKKSSDGATCVIS